MDFNNQTIKLLTEEERGEFFDLEELQNIVLPAILSCALAYGDGLFNAPVALISILTALLLSMVLKQFRNAIEQKTDWFSALLVFIGFSGCMWCFYQTTEKFAYYTILYLLTSVITIKLASLSWLLKPLEFIRILATGPIVIGSIYFLQANEINYAILLCGLPFSFFAISTKALKVENKNPKTVYFFTLAAYLMPIIIYLLTQDHAEILTAGLIALLVIWPLNVLTEINVTITKIQKSRRILFILSALYLGIFTIGWNFAIIRWFFPKIIAKFLPGLLP